VDHWIESAAYHRLLNHAHITDDAQCPYPQDVVCQLHSRENIKYPSEVITLTIKTIFYKRGLSPSEQRKYLACTHSICNFFCNQYTLSTCHVMQVCLAHLFSLTQKFPCHGMQSIIWPNGNILEENITLS